MSIQTSNKMAYPAINAAVSKVIFEAKIQVIDEFIKMLDNKIELDEDLKATFDDFKKSLEESSKAASKAANKAASKEPKKKRSATLFNLFVKEKQSELKAQHPQENGKTIIGMASKSWKEDPFALFIKEHGEKVKKDLIDFADNEMLYKMLKDMYETGVKPDEDLESEAPKKETKATGKGKKGAKAAAVVTDSEEEDQTDKPVTKKTGKGKK